jgi:hypothetical protein
MKLRAVSRLFHFMAFAPLKIFSFFGGAKLIEFRPTAPAQVVCWLPVGAWGRGEIV